MNNSEHHASMAIPVERGMEKSGQVLVANWVSGQMHQTDETAPPAPISNTPSKTGKRKKVGLALVGIVVCVALVVALNLQGKRKSPTFRNLGHGGQPPEDKDDPVPQIRLAAHARMPFPLAPLARQLPIAPRNGRCPSCLAIILSRPETHRERLSDPSKVLVLSGLLGGGVGRASWVLLAMLAQLASPLLCGVVRSCT